jgi:tRNA modification GTPase
MIAALNKNDLPRAWEVTAGADLFPRQVKILEISAKTGTGLEDLKKSMIHASVSDQTGSADGIMITNLRHKLAMEKACKNVERAKESISSGMSAEFAAFDLREALDNLDEITGKKINDEILDKIFSSFCIGK